MGIPAVHTERVVGCSGGTGDSEHVPLWFRCREGFLYRCGECDQIFMLVRVQYEVPEDANIGAPDPDVKDVFDFSLLRRATRCGTQVAWSTGQWLTMHSTARSTVVRLVMNSTSSARSVSEPPSDVMGDIHRASSFIELVVSSDRDSMP